jgi:carotenoid cleavage dioxygenase-like enzyme
LSNDQVSKNGKGMRFPRTATYSGFDAPGRVEADVCELEFDGEIPKDLNGIFYRVAPEPQFPPLLGDDILINGDGMVSMFRFEDGHVDFKSRYVRTEKFTMERAARRSLFGAYRNPFTDDPSVRGRDRGTANTNIVFHGDRLLALKEGNRPMELDPFSLDTVGQWAYHGKLSSQTATAHPKIDPETGELLFFGYAAKGETTRDIAFYVADPHGRIIQEEWFLAPYAALIHDFVVTRDHVVFPVMPTTTDMERLRAGGSHWLWDPTRPTLIGVFPRRGGVRDIRWFEGPPRWCFHYFNAYSKGSMVVVDGCASEAQLFPFFYPNTTGKPFDPQKAIPRVTRWMFDLSSNEKSFREETLWPEYAEFPRIDDRFALGDHRYGFVIANDPGRDFTGGGLFGPAFNTIARFDFHTLEAKRYELDSKSTAQEPVFVPRPGSTQQGEGYVLALVNRFDTMLNDLLVLDARNLEAGPVATIKLPLRLRNGVHGNWVPHHLLPHRG